MNPNNHRCTTIEKELMASLVQWETKLISKQEMYDQWFMVIAGTAETERCMNGYLNLTVTANDAIGWKAN